MKIPVLRVINSSSHRKCFVRGYMHLLFVPKALTLVPRSFGFLTQITRAYNPVRRTFYDVNYIDNLDCFKQTLNSNVDTYRGK